MSLVYIHLGFFCQRGITGIYPCWWSQKHHPLSFVSPSKTNGLWPVIVLGTRSNKKTNSWRHCMNWVNTDCFGVSKEKIKYYYWGYGHESATPLDSKSDDISNRQRIVCKFIGFWPGLGSVCFPAELQSHTILTDALFCFIKGARLFFATWWRRGGSDLFVYGVKVREESIFKHSSLLLLLSWP